MSVIFRWMGPPRIASKQPNKKKEEKRKEKNGFDNMISSQPLTTLSIEDKNSFLACLYYLLNPFYYLFSSFFSHSTQQLPFLWCTFATPYLCFFFLSTCACLCLLAPAHAHACACAVLVLVLVLCCAMLCLSSLVNSLFNIRCALLPAFPFLLVLILFFTKLPFCFAKGFIRLALVSQLQRFGISLVLRLILLGCD